MFKSLMLTALCVTGVGSPVISSDVVNNACVLSRSMSSNPSSFNVGDKFRLDWEVVYGQSSNTIKLFYNDDEGYLSLKLSNFVCTREDNETVIYSMYNNLYNLVYDFVSFTNILSQPNYGEIFYADTPEDIESIISLEMNRDYSYQCSIVLEVVGEFYGFSDDALPYLTKIDNGYVAPQKNNLYRYIYDFYYSLFSDTDTHAISTSYNMPFDNWLCHSLTIITLLVGVFVLFIFLKWLFKVVSGLILIK